MRRRHQTILAAAAAVITVVLLLGGFAAGYNFSSAAREYYTPGYQADLGFLPRLASAYLAFRSRRYEIADPLEQKARIEQVSHLRIGVYRPTKDYRVPIYDGLEMLGLDVRIVEPPVLPGELLERLDVIIFPQGWYELDQLPEGEGKRLKKVVAGGVDYIGICAGTYFAVDQLGIAPVVHKQLKMVSLVSVQTLANEFWGELGGREYQAHFSGGGYFPVAELGQFEPLVMMENLGAMAIQGAYEKGRVVLFTFHPEGGGLTRNNQSVYFSGRSLGTGEMLLKVLQDLAARHPGRNRSAS